MTSPSIKDKAVGLGALMLVGVVAIALLALFLWALVSSWKIILGFLIGATVIAAISIGIKR